MKRRMIRLIGGLALILILIAAASGIWLLSELEKPYLRARTDAVFVDIPRGASASQIADMLTKAGILRHALPFRLYVRYTGLGRHIQAGEYRFDTPASPKQVAERLIRGDVYYRAVTIPEGLSVQETVELLTANHLGDPEGLKRAILKTEWIRDLAPEARNLEGYLFPETYRFRRNADSETVIKTMVHQFRAQIEKALSFHPMPPGWTVSKIVILASMIEKEVRNAEEGPMVASVLINRLDSRMPLACDATIIYAMKLAGTYEGRLGKKDLAMDSPYNTYRHAGLPPGPICNPGADALRSALSPAKTDYFYYVSRNDGTHQFSKDYRSHLNAVNLFQRPLALRRQAGAP